MPKDIQGWGTPQIYPFWASGLENCACRRLLRSKRSIKSLFGGLKNHTAVPAKLRVSAR
jgi:hypothetical protein